MPRPNESARLKDGRPKAVLSSLCIPPCLSWQLRDMLAHLLPEQPVDGAATSMHTSQPLRLKDAGGGP